VCVCSGDVADEGQLAFDTSRIKRVFDAAAQKEDREHVAEFRPPVMFLSVDPTGEGSSKFAIHTDYYKGGCQYVSFSVSHLFFLFLLSLLQPLQLLLYCEVCGRGEPVQCGSMYVALQIDVVLSIEIVVCQWYLAVLHVHQKLAGVYLGLSSGHLHRIVLCVIRDAWSWHKMICEYLLFGEGVEDEREHVDDVVMINHALNTLLDPTLYDQSLRLLVLQLQHAQDAPAVVLQVASVSVAYHVFMTGADDVQ